MAHANARGLRLRERVGSPARGRSLRGTPSPTGARASAELAAPAMRQLARHGRKR